MNWFLDFEGNLSSLCTARKSFREETLPQELSLRLEFAEKKGHWLLFLQMEKQ